MATRRKSKSKGTGTMRRTKGGSRKGGAAKPGVQLGKEIVYLHARLDDLGQALIELHQVQRAARQRSTRVAAAGLADEEQPVTLKFKKTSGPDFVRITLLDTNEVVLGPDDDEAESRPRRVGAEFDALIEVKGNPNQVAVVEISHAIPKSIQLSARPDGPGNAGTKPLLVVG